MYVYSNGQTRIIKEISYIFEPSYYFRVTELQFCVIQPISGYTHCMSYIRMNFCMSLSVRVATQKPNTCTSSGYRESSASYGDSFASYDGGSVSYKDGSRIYMDSSATYKNILRRLCQLHNDDY